MFLSLTMCLTSKPAILFSFFLLFSTLLKAQEFVHYDITDGLSGIEVNDIKENENFLWIATTEGLNRFDGRNFRIYKREDDTENTLSENNIETLFFDSRGILWIGLKTGGVDLYDPRYDRFMHLKDLINIPCPSRVITIIEDSWQNIWLGTWEQGVYKLVPEVRGGNTFRAEVHFPKYIVSALTEKPKGYVRIGTYSGIFAYSLKENRWADTALYNMAVTQFLDRGSENSLWCSTWSSGLVEIAWDSHRPEAVSVEQSFKGEKYRSIHRILNAGDDSLYLGTWGEGLKVMDIRKPDLIAPLAPESCKASLINCLYRDRYNNIWIGSYGGGLYRFCPERDFITYFPQEEPLPAPAIAVADFGSGMLLAGTQGRGIYLCDLRSNAMMPKFGNNPDPDFRNYILSLWSDNAFVLAGHDGQGVPYYNGKEREPDFNFLELSGINQLEKATAFFPDGQGTLWVGTKQNGLFSASYDPVSLKPGKFIHHDNFGRDEITGFAGLSENRLLISSHKGLFIFNTLQNVIENEGSIIVDELVYCISRDDVNRCLWIGTSTGLMTISLDDPYKARKVLPGDLLPQGAIRQMVRDSGNNIWFTISDRLFCLTGTGSRLYELNRSVFEDRAILSCTTADIGGDENLVFGTSDRLVIINPALVLRQASSPGILFTGLEIDHLKVPVGSRIYRQVVLSEASEYVKSIRLSHKSKWISFHFVEKEWGISRSRYQYRLKGFSDKWQNLDISMPITFSQLNPGRYNLEIREYDASEEQEVLWSLDILALPLWRNAEWFYALLAIVILGAMGVTTLILTRYYRKRHMKRLHEIEKQKADELLREKESFFTGLSHDVMTPLSLIISPVNDLLRTSPPDDPRKEKLEIISRNTSFLSDIFGTILDFKRVELADNTVKETEVEIISFCRIALNAFEYLAKSRRIDLKYKPDIESLKILTDRVKIERILYNLLSNAIKFTPDGGEVSLEVITETAESLVLIVSDTGCGIDPRNSIVFEKFYRSPKHTSSSNPHGLGLGLYIVKEFVAILGGTISVNSTPGSGTRIIITIPCKPSPQGVMSSDDKQSVTINEEVPTILVVEDNDEMRDYVGKKLSEGFNVIMARNGIEALGIIERYLPEIVITDVMMPEMDGIILCKHLKGNDRYSDLFVVMLSAKTSTEDEMLAYKAGADIYLRKPLDTALLLSQMKNIHATRQARKSQLMASLLSEEGTEIELDPRETFVRKAMKVIEENIMDAEFKVDNFAAEMNMSNTVLHRKFRLYVGTTPNQFIRLVRLKRSVFLLRDSDYTIAEIANLTGFNQSHYFIKCFRGVYNETPGSFREKCRNLKE